MSDDDRDELESAETPEGSQPEEETPEEEAEETPEKETASKGVKKLDSDTEKIWGSLSGKTQDRIVQLVRKNKALEADLERERLAKAQGSPAPTPQPVSTEAPTELEVQEAVKKLRDYGVVTKEDLTRLQNNMFLEKEHDRLTGKFDGSDGLPKYVPDEVEDYAKSHYLGGNLEIAYRDMYRDELLDAEIKKRGSKKSETYTEKPTASVKLGEKPLTLESLRARLRQPDGADWWAKNREKIEPHLKKLTQK